jgi:hypothetical protein
MAWSLSYSTEKTLTCFSYVHASQTCFVSFLRVQKLDRDGFWDVMIRQINQIDYPNFKNHLLNEKRVDMNTYRAYEEVYYAAAFLENGDEPGVFPVEIGQE